MIFTGLSAFPITPAHADGRVDLEELTQVIDLIASAPVQSVCLLGSTGTYAYLTRNERQRAIVAAAEVVGGRVPLLVGVGALRTDEVCALAKDAASAGASGLLLAPVSYTPLTDEEVFEHFRTVAGSTDLLLCIYNNPTTTNFTFTADLLSRLALVPNIAAVKMPLPADDDVAHDLKRLRANLPEEFVIGYSGDWGCANALLRGANAWFSVLGGLFPQTCARLTRAAQSGQSAEVERIDKSLAPLWSLFRRHGSLRVAYACAQLMGLTAHNPPRPLLPLSPAAFAEVEAALVARKGLPDAAN